MIVGGKAVENRQTNQDSGEELSQTTVRRMLAIPEPVVSGGLWGRRLRHRGLLSVKMRQVDPVAVGRLPEESREGAGDRGEEALHTAPVRCGVCRSVFISVHFWEWYLWQCCIPRSASR